MSAGGHWEGQWFGPTIQQRVNRAAGRAIIGAGTLIAVNTKVVTHVLHGNLRRSVHVAPFPYEGADDDETLAEKGVDLLIETPHPTQTPIGPVVQVGSWMPYACVEWVGRGHPGVTQGLEMSRGKKMDAIFVQAFAEEGLA